MDGSNSEEEAKFTCAPERTYVILDGDKLAANVRDYENCTSW